MTCGKVRDIGSEAADRGDRPAVDLLAIALLWSMKKVVDSVANELRDRPSQARGDFFQSLGLLLRQFDLLGDHKACPLLDDFIMSRSHVAVDEKLRLADQGGDHDRPVLNQPGP